MQAERQEEAFRKGKLDDWRRCGSEKRGGIDGGEGMDDGGGALMNGGDGEERTGDGGQG